MANIADAAYTTFEAGAWVAQLCLGVVFGVSACTKLASPLRFAHGVAEYKILPARISFLFGFAVIGCEIFIAVSHLFGWLLSVAAPTGLLLLLSFLSAVSINLARRRVLPCYCFGAGKGELISVRSLARIAFALCGEALVLFRLSRSSASAHQSGRRLCPPSRGYYSSCSPATGVSARRKLQCSSAQALLDDRYGVRGDRE